MDHNYYRERISAYADNALPPYEQMAVEEHLATCAECRAALEKIRALSVWIEEKGILGESEYFEKQAQKIEERLGIAQTEVTPIVTKRTWRGVGWKLTAAAASIALVGILAFYTRDTIWQKTDQAPAMQAPRPAEGLKKGDSNEELRETSPATGISQDSAVKLDQKAGKPEAVSTALPKSRVQTESSSASKATPVPDNQNYKLSAPVPETVSDKLEDSPIDESLATSSELEKKEALPARRVDDLLRSVAGVKTKSDSGVTIRGGRAGEVEYLVDSAPSKDTIEGASEIKRVMKVQGLRDVLSKSDGSDTVTKTDEFLEDAKIQPSDVLAYWRGVRDSLAATPAPSVEMGKSIVAPPQPTKTLVQSLAPKKNGSDRNAKLLEACYRVAKLSSDTSEIHSVIEYIKRIAENPSSPEHSQAKAYLDSLGVK